MEHGRVGVGFVFGAQAGHEGGVGCGFGGWGRGWGGVEGGVVEEGGEGWWGVGGVVDVVLLEELGEGDELGVGDWVAGLGVGEGGFGWLLEFSILVW